VVAGHLPARPTSVLAWRKVVAAYNSSHHKALALIGRRLQWQLMMEVQLTFAWVTYPLETMLHWLFGLGNRWVFP
jgi:hypothetical protein